MLQLMLMCLILHWRSLYSFSTAVQVAFCRARGVEGSEGGSEAYMNALRSYLRVVKLLRGLHNPS